MTDTTDLAKQHPPRVKRTRVNGKKVIKDEPVLSGLSARHNKTIIFEKQRILTLDDGSQVFGCNVCEFTGTRGELNTHIQNDHPSGRPPAKATKGKAAADPLALIPEELGGMTLLEVFQLAMHANTWGDLLANAEAQVAERDAALAAERAAHAATRRQLAAVEKKVNALTDLFKPKPEEGDAK